jgi:hypothetical protein
MEGLMSKKTNEPPKRANHKGNIKFLSLVISILQIIPQDRWIQYQADLIGTMIRSLRQ